MKLHELLNENVEDEQAEANERAVALFAMAKGVVGKEDYARQKKDWEDANELFSDGYEGDEEDEGSGEMMGDGIDQLFSVGDELKELIGDHYGDKFDTELEKQLDRTDQIDP